MSLEQTTNLNKLVDTVFLKDFNKDNVSLKALEGELKKIENINSEEADRLRKNIYLRKQGLNGERSVYFELKHSLLPMICFHDITIKSGEKSAQIDFLVVTNKFMCILETKNLVGDITINEYGDFIREIKYKDGSFKEGMYSPITQGSRHARILKKALIELGIEELRTFPINSIAVMANPKNIINKTNAPSEISEKIYRCDQIVNFLEDEINSDKYNVVLSDYKIKNISNIILKIAQKENVLNIRSVQNLSAISESAVLPFSHSDTNVDKYINQKTNFNNDVYDLLHIKNEKLTKKLKQFRYQSAMEFNKKPYEVFKNKEMEELVSLKPKTIDELKKIKLPQWVIKDLGFKLLQIINPNVTYSEKNPSTIESRLKKYRYQTSVEKNIKPYEIFTNDELIRLVKIKPSTIDELFEIKGFNKKEKIVNYGKEIVNIINNIT